MSDTRELMAWRDNLQRLVDDKEAIMNSLVIGEGVHAVGVARKLATSEKVVNTGQYRGAFHTGNQKGYYGGKAEYDGSSPRKYGKRVEIDFYNNLNYAKPIEYGFRRHFVPGYWDGNTFVYDKNAKGGMMVPAKKSFQQGKYIMFRALRQTEKTQEPRLRRKINKIIEKYMEGGSINDY